MYKILPLLFLLSISLFAQRGEVKFLKDENAHLKEVKMNLEEEIYDLKAELKKGSSGEDSLKVQVADRDKQIKRLSQENAQLKATNTSIKAQSSLVPALTTERDQLKRQTQSKDAQIKQLRATTSSLQQQITSLQAEKAALQGGATSGQTALAQTQGQLQKTTAERDALRAQLQQAQQQLAQRSTKPAAQVTAPAPVATTQINQAQTTTTPPQHSGPATPFNKQSISAKLLSKQMTNNKEVALTVQFANSSSSAVTSLEAHARIIIAGRFVTNLSIKLDKTIDAQGMLVWRAMFPYLPNHPGQQAFVSGKVEDVMMLFEPELVTFADGTIRRY